MSVHVYVTVYVAHVLSTCYTEKASPARHRPEQLQFEQLQFVVCLQSGWPACQDFVCTQLSVSVSVRRGLHTGVF